MKYIKTTMNKVGSWQLAKEISDKIKEYNGSGFNVFRINELLNENENIES